MIIRDYSYLTGMPMIDAEFNPKNWPHLNFIELETHVQFLESKLKGSKLNCVFVPECREYFDGFFKNEWILDFYSSKESFQLFLSLRPQFVGLGLAPVKKFTPSKKATHSAFELLLKKNLEGKLVESIKVFKNERAVVLNFSGDLKLVLGLIPNKPAAFLMQDQEKMGELYKDTEVPTDRSVAPAKMPASFFETAGVALDQYSELLFHARTLQAKSLTTRKNDKIILDQITQLQKKIKSFAQQVIEANKEPDWNAHGNLLKAHLYENPKLISRQVDGKTIFGYELRDYETEKNIFIKGFKELAAKDAAQKYFKLAKRKALKISEAETRMSEVVLKLDQLKTKTSIQVDEGNVSQEKVSAKKFPLKNFTTEEGLQIWVGRNQKENTLLLQKVARGNDLWFHLRGKPSAHVLISIPAQKTASLESLLDAANLCILYSDGRDWGKTEVDYCFRKYVKNIKGSKKVTYSQQKTLVVAFDEERIERLSCES